MVKKPFSIRVEKTIINKFKAIATVENMDGSKLLQCMLFEWEKKLENEKREAYDALLRVWSNDYNSSE